MITLIFGQLNCGKHNVANELKTRFDEEVITLADLRKKYLKDFYTDEPFRDLANRFGTFNLKVDDILLTVACTYFSETDITIIVPNSCKDVAISCCSKLPYVRCILIAPSATTIAKLRRKTVPVEDYNPDYSIPSEHYYNEVSIRRNTARLVKETLMLAEACGVSERFWCYVAPEYLV